MQSTTSEVLLCAKRKKQSIFFVKIIKKSLANEK
jgi:hypothetical protein